MAKARAFWGDPDLTAAGVDRAAWTSRAARSRLESASWQRAQRQNALRQLIAGSPDYQTS